MKENQDGGLTEEQELSGKAAAVLAFRCKICNEFFLSADLLSLSPALLFSECCGVCNPMSVFRGT